MYCRPKVLGLNITLNHRLKSKKSKRLKKSHFFDFPKNVKYAFLNYVYCIAQHYDYIGP